MRFTKAEIFKKVRAAAVVVAVALTSLVGWGASPADASSCEVWRFNYQGYMKCHTHVCDLKIGSTVVESWVVADNRTIWHAWQNSNGWREMPNSGRATDTVVCRVKDNGHRTIVVCVAAFDPVWYSERDNAGTWWGWYQGVGEC